MGILQHLFRTKPIEVINAEELKGELPRELGLWDLIAIGIGGTVGSGVFATTGDIISGASGGGAGPAAFISWTIAGVACILSGFAYMEMSALVPSSGSTYAYSYHVLGELPAFVAAWLLTLEYGMSGAGVARSWAQKVQEWADESGGDHTFLNEEHYNVLGSGIMFLSVLILLAGIRFGKVFINFVSTIKVAVVLVIIVAGFAATNSDNLTPFIPPKNETTKLFGVPGIMLGASQAFFGFIGFDEVCCLAAEAKNPRKTMPRAVIGVILGTMFLSCFASLALSGMVPSSVYSHLPYDMGNDADGNPRGNLTYFSFPGAFGFVGYTAAELIVRIGEVGTMPIVVLIAFLAQPRLMYALSVDGLIPEIFGRVDSKGNLFWCTVIAGGFFVVVAFVIPFGAIWNIVSFGILVSFIMTNSSLLLIRTRESSPGLAYKLTAAAVATSCAAMMTFQKGFVDGRSHVALGVSMGLLAVTFALGTALYVKCPQNIGGADMFRAPLVPFIPLLSITVNWFLVAQLGEKDIARGCIWIGCAIIAYFLYGFSHSEGRSGWIKMLNHTVLGLNEVRPSMSSMVHLGGMKKTLLTPSQAQS
ncbi:hypothetical protein DYB37_012414 [Aphanomyces astaci]|uniref:Cationic amino acid transporter C-terminal domain-containing protein n=1 Tax=Aphanomyces astaci TaxID=112090 RepID=A0A397CX87_APHAT|nr:hypothetical protein DYB30_004710 [Aphanomyces astaci]RHY61046.1 hypothetical protein DYB34_007945 [Aphanomyces astaci]RHY70655.1 hypothetical protein DYB38_009559 [Aphanomyces astaci]RHZ01487.1 hypothetical protein DYB35_008810 [Aphanomyces astaci]RHZ03368.1 hypothetical protein DYB37_012414 [Aphanomyces astaci]